VERCSFSRAHGGLHGGSSGSIVRGGLDGGLGVEHVVPAGVASPPLAGVAGGVAGVVVPAGVKKRSTIHYSDVTALQVTDSHTVFSMCLRSHHAYCVHWKVTARPGPRRRGGDGARGSLDPPRRSAAHTLATAAAGARTGAIFLH
jgi:hypothetical protein